MKRISSPLLRKLLLFVRPSGARDEESTPIKSTEGSPLKYRMGQRWQIQYNQHGIKLNRLPLVSCTASSMTYDSLGLQAQQVFALSCPGYSCGLHPAPLLWAPVTLLRHVEFFKLKGLGVTSPQNFPVPEAFLASPTTIAKRTLKTRSRPRCVIPLNHF